MTLPAPKTVSGISPNRGSMLIDYPYVPVISSVGYDRLSGFGVIAEIKQLDHQRLDSVELQLAGPAGVPKDQTGRYRYVTIDELLAAGFILV
jgi:hypothetical protein